MATYVFEYIFPACQAFLCLKMQMSTTHTLTVKKLFRAMFKAIPFKQKTIHDRKIQNFTREIKNNPQMKELSGNFSLEQQGITLDVDGTGFGDRDGELTVASKLHMFMSNVRSNNKMKIAKAKEFKALVSFIIDIDYHTNMAFNGTATITV